MGALPPKPLSRTFVLALVWIVAIGFGVLGVLLGYVWGTTSVTPNYGGVIIALLAVVVVVMLYLLILLSRVAMPQAIGKP